MTVFAPGVYQALSGLDRKGWRTRKGARLTSVLTPLTEGIRPGETVVFQAYGDSDLGHPATRAVLLKADASGTVDVTFDDITLTTRTG